MFTVKLYEDSIYLRDGSEELVMWVQDEWIEDPSLVWSIVNAVRIGYEAGPEELRRILVGEEGR